MQTLLSLIAHTPLRRPARRPWIVAAYVAAGIGTLAGSLAMPASGVSAPVAARAASDFRDSIGVQTHFPFTGYAYDAASTDDLAGLLRTLGVRHLRDDVCFNTEQACERVRARLAAMQGALGPGAPAVDLLAGYTRELAAVPARSARDADIVRALTAATTPPLASMISALEPVNEPDLKDARDWTTATLADDATYQRLLNEPRFASLRTTPHLSPAVGHAANTPALLAGGWTAAHADVGNFHPYPAAWGGPEHALNTACGTTTALACARSLGRGAGPIATESGYSTSGSPLSTNWVSERAQATYLPRLVLENFRAGVARTYLYELVDLRPARGSAVDGYGLWRARAAGSQFVPGEPKPAAGALSRMNATIGDLGASATTATVDLTVRSGGRELSDDMVRRVLLRRANGTYVLALWQPKAVWDNTTFKQSDRSVAELAASVSIGGDAWMITATRPTLGGDTTGRWDAANTVDVPIGADVTLLDLHPHGTVTGDAPAATPSGDAAPALGGAQAQTPAAPAASAATASPHESGAAANAAAVATTPTAPHPTTASPTGNAADPTTSARGSSRSAKASARSKARVRARARAGRRRARLAAAHPAAA